MIAGETPSPPSSLAIAVVTAIEASVSSPFSLTLWTPIKASGRTMRREAAANRRKQANEHSLSSPTNAAASSLLITLASFSASRTFPPGLSRANAMRSAGGIVFRNSIKRWKSPDMMGPRSKIRTAGASRGSLWYCSACPTEPQQRQARAVSAAKRATLLRPGRLGSTSRGITAALIIQSKHRASAHPIEHLAVASCCGRARRWRSVTNAVHNRADAIP